MTQTERLIRNLEDCDLTSLELTLRGCGVRIGARIFDARKQGHTITSYRDEQGNVRYHLVQEPKQLAVGL